MLNNLKPKSSKLICKESMKKKQQKIRVFQESWKKDFAWLKYDNEENKEIICTTCKKYVQVGSFVTGSKNFKVQTIKTHASSEGRIKMNYEQKLHQLVLVAHNSLLERSPIPCHVVLNIPKMLHSILQLIILRDFLFFSENKE